MDGLALAYAHTEVLQVPDRTVRPELLRPLLRACRDGLRLECEHVSFATPDAEIRLITPHTLIYTGMRWHVRAYCEKNKDYRDFVLSRFRGVPPVATLLAASPADTAARRGHAGHGCRNHRGHLQEIPMSTTLR